MEAIGLLQRLANDPEPAVAIIAGTRVLEIDPGLLIPMVERLLASPDANLRSLGVEVLYRRPSEAHVHLLADRLDDPHSDVRAQARRHLEELARTDFRDRVITEGARMLATQQWRGMEQATILLTLLDHKPAAPRLVELLPFNRPEVGITAAWGLRRMAVPETLPGVVKYVQVGLSRPVVPGHVPDPRDIASLMMDHQLSQLNQLLGKQKYGPADEVLRKFIPRRADNSWPESRAAAIWALGLIHEGTTQEALASAAERRLNDIATTPPEDPQVRRMSAITLARLRAKQALPSLHKICPKFEPSEDPVITACGWAIEQLTGEAMPPPQPILKMQRDWFLAPHK
jgi:HEAT repeat protein